MLYKLGDRKFDNLQRMLIEIFTNAMLLVPRELERYKKFMNNY